LEPQTTPIPAKGANLAEIARNALLSVFAPPAIIVNDKGDLLYVYGETGKYLRPGPGQASLNIATMAREGLQSRMRSALLAASAHRQDAVYRGLRVKTNGAAEKVDLIVKVLSQGEEKAPLFMFMFEEHKEPTARLKRGKEEGENVDHGRVAELEKELTYARESLQTTIDELQAANEEMTSANEEMQSTNEELQSTNEELETSKEELQSVNEELTTVNSELQSKLTQLSLSESDMKNLLDSTEIAMIFLDNDLHVKRFTATAASVINLIKGDIGRPIGDVTLRIDYPDIVENAKKVLDSLVPFETEVETKDDHWFLIRIRPYRTLENVIDGVAMTFTDITEAKRADRERAEFAESIVQTVREPLLVLDGALRVVLANKAFYTLFGVSPGETEGQFFKDLGKEEWDLPVLNELLLKVAKAGKVFEDFKVSANFPSIGPRTIALNARRIKGAVHQASPLILLAMEVVTDNDQSPPVRPGEKRKSGTKANRAKEPGNGPRR
jgi:two-component system, chemotaxis family, CheB/CheR fusion protein